MYIDGEGGCWDEVSNKPLETDAVIAARMDEIKQIHLHGVYDKVSIQDCWDNTGKPPVKVKWVDINKGDDINPDVRCGCQRNQD